MGAGTQLRAGVGRTRPHGSSILSDHVGAADSSGIGRFALRLSVPALALPFITGAANAFARQYDGSVDNGLGSIIAIVYLFVLLGSMTLNTWLLLRHPHTYRLRALPRVASVMLVILWSTLVLWAVAVAIPALGSRERDWIMLAAAIVCILLSIATFFTAILRSVAPEDRVPIESLELGPRTRVVLWLYLVASTLAVLSYIGLSVTGSEYSAVGGLLGSRTSLFLLALGLPWTWPLHVIATVGAFMLPSPIAPGISAVAPVLGIAISIVLVVALIFSPTRRVILVNWFFRLTPRKTASAPPR